MSLHREHIKAPTQSANEATAAVRAVAPEDLRRGMFVVVLHTIDESFPWWVFCDKSAWDDRSAVPQRMAWLPTEDIGHPLEVVDLCLPFVLVRDALALKSERVRAVDVRSVRLGRVSPRYARTFVGQRRHGKKRRANRQ